VARQRKKAGRIAAHNLALQADLSRLTRQGIGRVREEMEIQGNLLFLLPHKRFGSFCLKKT